MTSSDPSLESVGQSRTRSQASLSRNEGRSSARPKGGLRSGRSISSEKSQGWVFHGQASHEVARGNPHPREKKAIPRIFGVFGRDVDFSMLPSERSGSAKAAALADEARVSNRLSSNRSSTTIHSAMTDERVWAEAKARRAEAEAETRQYWQRMTSSYQDLCRPPRHPTITVPNQVQQQQRLPTGVSLDLSFYDSQQRSQRLGQTRKVRCMCDVCIFDVCMCDVCAMYVRCV